MNRVRPVFVGAFLVWGCVAAAAQVAPPPQAPAPAGQGKSLILEKVIVKVNGEILTLTELERMQIDALQDQNRQATPRDLSTDPKLMAALADITPDLLIRTIDDLLIVQHGRELGIKFTDENFRMALDNVKKQNKMDDKQLAAALQAEGLTVEQLRQNFEKSWIRQSVEQREIMTHMTITEQEARQYYKQYPDQFMKPPTVTVREILIAVPTETVGGQATVNVAKDDAAKEKAEQLRARAVKGDDFVALVAEASDSGTKANGGMIGPILIEELSPVVGNALAKLKPGEISEVIRTPRGYQFFKLETRTPSETEPFDKVRNQIGQRIMETRLEGETEKFLVKLRSQAVLEWKDDYYKKLFDQGQARRAKAK